MLVKVKPVTLTHSQKISTQNLERTIIAAFNKIDCKRTEQAKKALSNDSLAESTKTILYCAFGFIALFFFIALSMLVASLIFKMPELESINSLSIFYRIIFAYLSLFFIVACIYMIRAVKKESDRNYLVSFFSAITAIAALIIALLK